MYVEAELSTGEDGTERIIDTLSLIGKRPELPNIVQIDSILDAVMPDVVNSTKKSVQERQVGYLF